MKNVTWIKELPVVTETEVRPRNCIVVYNDIGIDIVQNNITRFSSRDGWKGYTNVAFEVALEVGKIDLVKAYVVRWDYMQKREKQHNWKLDKIIERANQMLQTGYKWTASK